MYRLLLLVLLTLAKLSCCGGTSASQDRQKPLRTDQALLDHARQVLLSEKSSACETQCANFALQSNITLFFTPDEITNYHLAQQGELIPACRVEPTTSQEVAWLLEGLQASNCHFAVKAGGHSVHASASNTDGGVTVSLRRMNGVEVSEDRKTVKIGAGALWSEVYEVVEKEGSLVVGGRGANIGVGGFILGGGIGWVTHRHGAAIDAVTALEIVVPNGSPGAADLSDKQSAVRLLDQSNDPELFRAIKGAGLTNFGIVTSFTLEAIPHTSTGKLWNKVTVHPWEGAIELTQLQNDHLSIDDKSDPDAFQLLVYVYNAEADQSLVTLFQVHNNHSDPATSPDIFNRSSHLTPLFPAEAQLQTYLKMIEDASQYAPPDGKRAHYATTSFRPSPAAIPEIVALIEFFLTETKHIPNRIAAANLQPLYRTFFSSMEKHGGRAPVGILEEAEGDEPLHLHILSDGLNWDNASDDEFMYGAVWKLIEGVEAVTKRYGVFHPYKYVNYAAEWQEEGVWEVFGEEELGELRGLQRRVDPRGVFVRGGGCEGGFKLNGRVKGADMGREGGGRSGGGGAGKDEL